MYIKRIIEKQILDAATEYAALAILGPRQSGKTTTARALFPNHLYLSLENPDTRERAQQDPRSFLQEHTKYAGLILDEFQHVPHLLSYLQTIIDTGVKPGTFILTGSQNFLLNANISQSLAGRIAILTLLPLSIAELQETNQLTSQIEDALFTGCYPTLYNQKSNVSRHYQGYITTYIERDVRQLKNITDLDTFQRFIGLCAGRIGQEVNYTSLSNDCGIDVKTVKSWLAILQASYIIFLLQPYYNNFGKRLIKSPKLYFIDTGLACTLLRIKSADELITHPARGGLFESYIIADLLKQQYNQELLPSLYFWRDVAGNEVDCIIDEGQSIYMLEMKSGRTISSSFFKNFDYIASLQTKPTTNFVVYAGDDKQNWSKGTVLGWQNIGMLIESTITKQG